MKALEFNFKKIESRDGSVTTYSFMVLHLGNPIWPIRGSQNGIEIQIDDLLSHLAEFWKPLLLRQTYPIDLNPQRPSHIDADARAWLASTPASQAEIDDDALEDFRECHELSQCFAGYFELPPLWILRSGEDMIIDTGTILLRIDFYAVKDALDRAGDWIASKLRGERWSKLLTAWAERDQGNAISLLRWSTSLETETVTHLADIGLLKQPKSVSDAANDNDVIRMAARMSSALSPEDVEKILFRISTIPSSSMDRRVCIHEIVEHNSYLEYDRKRPFEQGEILARSVRQYFTLNDNEEVDIEDVFRKLGIEVIAEDLDLDTLDAIAVWGSEHGPATLINQTSSRHQAVPNKSIFDQGQIRATLAHELCHFLVDKEHALAAVEVLKSRMPVVIEQRARAFAAEFLLPSSAAEDAWNKAGCPKDKQSLDLLLAELCESFVVSKSVASWKLEHGARNRGVKLDRVLESLVPGR